MKTRGIASLLCALLVSMSLAGCMHPQAQTSPSSKLLGMWYDSKSGEPYEFISSSMLVVPHAQQGGGNAVPYRILDGNTLDIVSAGSHHVSTIETVSADKLVLSDPLSGSVQRFYRSIGRTQHFKSIEASALAAASDFGTVSPDPDIVWVAKKPTGKGAEWVDWSPTSLTTYGTAWDWSTLRRDKTPTLASGSGSAMGFQFGFARKVPTAKQLEAFKNDTSLEATAGFSHIDVGYSASKAKYPAGTLVYLSGGLIYSLGDGFAIAVGIDRKNQSFMPLTHN